MAVTGAGSERGTVWGQGGNLSAKNGARDVISIVTISTSRGVVNVKIGSQTQAFQHSECATWPACYFEMPFNGRTGAVTLSFDGRVVTGPPINACEDNCPVILL
jgi:glucan endo-1,3-alpha-glucosidase